MRIVKVLGVLFIVYAGIVASFETMLKLGQPPSTSPTLVITTTNDDGEESSRVVAHITLDGESYVAANHWPRTWYYEALANPSVAATIDGATANYTAIPVERKDYVRVDAAHKLGIGFRIITGFPPRRFLQLAQIP